VHMMPAGAACVHHHHAYRRQRSGQQPYAQYPFRQTSGTSK
jgi:hypothetical protein